MLDWISEFVQRRQGEAPQGDVVDAVLDADIDGRPITHEEIVGVIQLLLFGGLDTTAGVLGMTMLRFCEDPDIPARLRDDPALIPEAAEELLRLDAPFVFIARTATPGDRAGRPDDRRGRQVLISWASANRDDAEFDVPATSSTRTGRPNRHLAFGAGPHRCAGSNLARMNIRLALEEVLVRLHDIRLADGADTAYHSGFSRTPVAVPIDLHAGRLTAFCAETVALATVSA